MNDLLYDMSRMAPLQAGCIEGNSMILYPSLHSAAGTVARFLRDAQGLRAGDRVVVLAERQWRWIPLLFGLFREGILAVPLNLRLPPAALRERIRRVAPRLLVLDEARAGLFPEYPSVTMESLCTNSVHQSLPGPVEVDLNAAATLLFSSGSSGHPRALVHSYGNHYFSAMGAQRHFPLGVADRWLLSLPLYHVGGLGILFRCLLAGATVVIPEEGASLADSVLSQRVNHLSLVPTQLQRLLAHPEAPALARRLKRVLLGGAPIPRDLVARARAAGFPVFATYGLTETSSLVSAVAPGADETLKRASDGICLQHREIRVDESGEILVRGPVVCLGEWEEGGIKPLPAREGWYATGDLGRLEHGNLRVHGRKDAQFISGGENIQPEEIERVVAEVTAAGLVVVTPVADPEFGQRPCAWIDLPAAEWQLSAWIPRLRERLPGYMLPVQWRELPASHGLKPDRRALQGL